MTTPQRSYNMSRIRGKDTKPEMIVRKYLWAHGFRYRLNHRRLPGKPDIVLRKYRTCIFVNGCFWHGHGLPLGAIENGKLKMENELGALGAIENGKLKMENEVGALGAIENGKLKMENEVGALGAIESSKCCKIPKTNREFWVKKIIRNKNRDIEVQKELAKMGWHCITVWECELSTGTMTGTGTGMKTVREMTLESLGYTLNKIYLQDHTIHHKSMAYTIPEDEEYAMAAEDLHDI